MAKLYLKTSKHAPYEDLCNYSQINIEELRFLDEFFGSKANIKNFDKFLRNDFLRELFEDFCSKGHLLALIAQTFSLSNFKENEISSHEINEIDQQNRATLSH